MLYNAITTLLVFVLVAYAMGVVAGIHHERQRSRKMGTYVSSHYYECKECVPGVTFRIDADSNSHLEQAIDWHEQDYHDEEN